MNQSRGGTLAATLLAIVAFVVALLAWLAPFSPVGPSPFAPRKIETTLTNSLPTEPTPVNISVPTAEPSPVSTPGPTLIPIQQWTNETTFTVAQGWDLLVDEDGETGFESGEFYIRNKKNNLVYISLWKAVGGNIGNAVISVDLARPSLGDSPEAAGVVFGWQPSSQGNTYAFLVEKNGRCKFREESYNAWPSVSQGQVDNFLTQKETHTVTVVLENGHAYGFVDGTYCDDYLMPSYEPGYIGVVAHSGNSQEDGSKGYFDNARFANLP